ncbi:MAG TPA: hypothetical protein VFE47_03135 [Tepidisphaeraceae bacterium]|jgi:hypothetical protein|nr:hypothetical protein [Tepidisphaeraceae bacterium]
MATEIITLSDELGRIAGARAAAEGYSNVSQYVQALIQADAGEPLTPEMEDHLLKSLDSPSIEVTPGYWDAKRRKLAEAGQ